jgi:hypothetical protein
MSVVSKQLPVLVMQLARKCLKTNKNLLRLDNSLLHGVILFLHSFFGHFVEKWKHPKQKQKKHNSSHTSNTHLMLTFYRRGLVCCEQT